MTETCDDPKERLEEFRENFPLYSIPELRLAEAAANAADDLVRVNFMEVADRLRDIAHPLAAKFIYVTLYLIPIEDQSPGPLNYFAISTNSILDAWYATMIRGLIYDVHFTMAFPWEALSPEFQARLKVFEPIHLQIHISELAILLRSHSTEPIEFRANLKKLGDLLQTYEHPLHLQFIQIAHIVIHSGKSEEPTPYYRWLVQMIYGLARDPNFEIPCPEPIGS